MSRWLGFRLDVECAIILIFTSLGAVVVRQYSDIDVGLLGFTIVYVVALSGLFQWTVRQSAEVETMMTSVERIAEYSLLPPEKGYRPLEMPASLPPKSSLVSLQSIQGSIDVNNSDKYALVPMKLTEIESAELQEIQLQPVDGDIYGEKRGEVQLKDLIVRYREDLEPVLRYKPIKLSFTNT